MGLTGASSHTSTVHFDLISPTLSCPLPSCPVLTPADSLPKLPLSTFLSFNSSQLDGFVSSESKFFLLIISVITQFRKEPAAGFRASSADLKQATFAAVTPETLTQATGPYLEFHIFTDPSKEITKMQSIVCPLPAGKFFENRNLTSTNVLSTLMLTSWSCKMRVTFNQRAHCNLTF